MKIEIGEFIVLKATMKNTEGKHRNCVLYISKEFPLKQIRWAIDEGFYTVRYANEEEIEYCHFITEGLAKIGAELDGIEHWRKLKLKINGA